MGRGKNNNQGWLRPALLLSAALTGLYGVPASAAVGDGSDTKRPLGILLNNQPEEPRSTGGTSGASQTAPVLPKALSTQAREPAPTRLFNAAPGETTAPQRTVVTAPRPVPSTLYNAPQAAP